MEDTTSKLRNLTKLGAVEFLEMGRLIKEAEEQKPWKAWELMNLTKEQWLAGELSIPPSVARDAKDAYLYLGHFTNFDGLTTGKIRLILPKLRDGEKVEIWFLEATGLPYRDLRDEINEKKNKENCKHDWKKVIKESWECSKCNRRIYTDPNKKEL